MCKLKIAFQVLLGHFVYGIIKLNAWPLFYGPYFSGLYLCVCVGGGQKL